jgi:hypothetical protein
MKMNLDELRNVVRGMVREAKGKAKKVKVVARKTQPTGFGYSEAFNLSRPLGVHNLYHRQGVANFGPYTGTAGPTIPDSPRGIDVPVAPLPLAEVALRSIVGDVIDEDIERDPWRYLGAAYGTGLHEAARGSAWRPVERFLDEKRGGAFKRLKKKLSGKKGVTDPAALAGVIGRKKLGSKEMTKRSVAGRKKKG